MKGKKRVERYMVKCYFADNDPNSKCLGYISETFIMAQGDVTHFEEWFLLPIRFSPKYKRRIRIIEEARRAMLLSMENARPLASQTAIRFMPQWVADRRGRQRLMFPRRNRRLDLLTSKEYI